jgi:hypothetical protein
MNKSRLVKIAIVSSLLAVLCEGLTTDTAHARDGGFPYERFGFTDSMAGFSAGHVGTHISDFAHRNASNESDPFCRYSSVSTSGQQLGWHGGEDSRTRKQSFEGRSLGRPSRLGCSRGPADSLAQACLARGFHRGSINTADCSRDRTCGWFAQRTKGHHLRTNHSARTFDRAVQRAYGYPTRG